MSEEMRWRRKKIVISQIHIVLVLSNLAINFGLLLSQVYRRTLLLCKIPPGKLKPTHKKPTPAFLVYERPTAAA